jgi:hypothetical protein
VCNYEKIKPLYLKELSETIREGDYTYAFNSYLLPDHWEEAADTLIKYYWDVKDEDTRKKINEAIVRIKEKRAKQHYILVCQKEPAEIVDGLFIRLSVDSTLSKEILPYIRDKKNRFMWQVFWETLYRKK